MGNHRIVPIDEGQQAVVFPDEPALLSFCRLLQHKAQPGSSAFILDAGKTTAATAKPYPFGFTQADPLEGMIGSRCHCLREDRIQVIDQPADAQLTRQFVQGLLGKAVALPQGRKGSPPLLCAAASNGAGRLPG